MSEKIDELVVTEEGLKELQDRLAYLKDVKRYEIAERINIARGYGDLSENAEYDEAKMEQGFLEGEISELEARLRKLKIISNDDINIGEVSVGTIVKVKNLGTGTETEYRIVGNAESDILKGKLSNTSPVGRGLTGHKVGEVVAIEIPAGTVEYEILEIRR